MDNIPANLVVSDVSDSLVQLTIGFWSRYEKPEVEGNKVYLRIRGSNQRFVVTVQEEIDNSTKTE